MRAFITGISGFAGTHLAEHLLASGDAVRGCSTHGCWKSSVPPSLSASVLNLPWDLRESCPDALLVRLQEFQPQAIYHLAALSVPSDCGSDTPTRAAMEINVEGSRHVCELARKLSPPPRLLLISSCYVYSFDPTQTEPLSEETVTEPQRAYGITKLAAERLLQQAIVADDIDGVVARVFQHSGPRQSPRMILSEWAQKFARGDNPVQVRSLDTSLDLSDVRDVVRAYRLLIQAGAKGEVYNVGQGHATTSRELAELLLHECGDRRMEEQQTGPRQNPIADISKIRAAVGWKPRIPLGETVRDTVAYWRGELGCTTELSR